MVVVCLYCGCERKGEGGRWVSDVHNARPRARHYVTLSRDKRGREGALGRVFSRAPRASPLCTLGVISASIPVSDHRVVAGGRGRSGTGAQGSAIGQRPCREMRHSWGRCVGVCAWLQRRDDLIPTAARWAVVGRSSGMMAGRSSAGPLAWPLVRDERIPPMFRR